MRFKISIFIFLVILFCNSCVKKEEKNESVINENINRLLKPYFNNWDEDFVFWLIPISGCNTCIEDNFVYILNEGKIIPNVLISHQINDKIQLKIYKEQINALKNGGFNIAIDTIGFVYQYDLGVLAPSLVSIENGRLKNIVEISKNKQEITNLLD